MIEKSPKFIWGVISIGIYVFVVGMLVFYFNTREKTKPRHYVKKDEHRIQVALSSPKSVQKKKVSKPKTKIKPKPKKIVKKKVLKKKVVKKPKKKVLKKKFIKKKVVKKKTVKKKVIKKKDVNLTKPKKQKTIDLFAKIKTPKKEKPIQNRKKPVKVKIKQNSTKISTMSASKRISDSLKKQKSSDSGEKNAYFSKVETMLRAWPARSDFLGEEATVTLYIKPTGKFKYQVKSGTENKDFTNSVESFLKQLQNIGLGRHNAGRTYEFEVEFSTKQ